MRLLYSIGLLIGGTLLGWVGALFDHGNWLGGWSLLFSTFGSGLGVWVVYKLIHR
jgi:hypothetical protein